MTLGPNIQEQIVRARADLRMGVPVLLENENLAFIVPAETLSSERFKNLKAVSHKLVLVLTVQRAKTLNVPAYDGDLVRIQIPSNTTLNWLKSLANPATDLDDPIRGPFQFIRTGNNNLERFSISLVKSAHLLPAAIVAYVDKTSSSPNCTNFTKLNVGSSALLQSNPSSLSCIASATLPIFPGQKALLQVFRPENGTEDHYALKIGSTLNTNPILVRLHSACFTGDVLGSLKCDCGPQLSSALFQISREERGGILIYLNQEGRGIGLVNKMRAYTLQSQGFDTVEANHRLGFEDDERDFRLGASILTKLGFSEIKLMTNNPEKIKIMENQGVRVTERVPLLITPTEHNHNYLNTKAKKSGHLI